MEGGTEFERFSLVRSRYVLATPAIIATSVISSPLSDSSSAATIRSPRVIACTGASAPAFRPTEFVIACGDGNSYVAGITWSSWTSRVAHGHGTLETNTCQPDCAQGLCTSSPTNISLSTPVKTRYGSLFSIAVVGAATLQLAPPGVRTKSHRQKVG